MKVLIIGGNRFFGKTLSRKLCELGHDVTILNRGNLENPYVSQKIIMDRLDFSVDHPMLKGKSWDLIYDQVCYDSKEALTSCNTFADKSDKYIFGSTQSVYQQKRDSLLRQYVYHLC